MAAVPCMRNAIRERKTFCKPKEWSMTENCRVNDCQKRLLVASLERLLRFCDGATEYEMQHPADYSPYLDAKALLDQMAISSDIREGK
jgi:hypothetical protein